MKVIAPCLWFDDQAEKAAQFYVGIFKKARIVQVARYPKVGQGDPWPQGGLGHDG